MKVGTGRLRRRLDKYGVNYTLVKGWDSPTIDPYGGRNDMQGIVLHHTAGRDSLNYICQTNPYAPVRAAHFLVGRNGKVYRLLRLRCLPRRQGRPVAHHQVGDHPQGFRQLPHLRH
jgi:hypothetical protein